MIFKTKNKFHLAALFLMAVILFIPARAEAAKMVSSLEFCGEGVPLQQPEIYESVEQNLLLLSEAKSRVWLALKRSGRFLPMIERALKEAKMPGDLKYVALVTTGLAPDYSGGGGKGMWRLKESEAAALGLTVNKEVDERLDPVRSTEAALKRLAALKTTYGNWTMAVAAYLEGEEVIKAAQSEAGGEKNFYNLYLPGGDKHMGMLLAGKMVFGNPVQFGYQQSSANVWSTFNAKRETVAAATGLRALATQHGVDYKRFRDMNPHLLSDTVPAGTGINVPK